MSNPKISVLIPIFNVEKYLRECLDSVVNQTLKDIEIICIDDGSTDSSPKIIREYAKKDSRFVVITKKNSGYGDSMNKGIAKATGEYIGIVESDDFIDPDMFEKLYKLAKKHNAEVVKSNFYYYYTDIDEKSPQWDESIGAVYNTEQKKVITSHDTKFDAVRKDETNQVINPRKKQHIFYQKPAIWSAIYNREFLSKADISFLASPGASYQDTGFNFKVWAKANRVVFTGDAFLHYRQDNEASSINNPGKIMCVSDEYKEIEHFLKKHNLVDELGPLAQKTKYGAYTWNFNRLEKGLDEEFLKTFSGEYQAADKSGVLDYTFFDASERYDLQEILNNPKMFLKRKHAREKAKVSVIVPIYNVEKYLEQCLDSILSQTLKDIEVVCVNDGSTDHSLSILEKYHTKDPRIVIRNTPNRGLAAARNHGISRASAQYFMFCDSDDFYNSGSCELLYNAITRHDTDIAIGGTEVVYTDPRLKSYQRTDEEYFKLNYNKKVDVTDYNVRRTDVSAWNKIYKSSIQKMYGVWFPNGMWYEDARFFNDYMMVSKTAYYLKNEKVYNYIRRVDSIMSVTAHKTPKAVDHVRVMVESFHFMKKHNLLKDHVKLFIHNYSKYYKLALLYTPDSHHEEVYAITRDFLKNHGNYLDSIDPSIKREIRALLPEQSPTRKILSASKRAAKKILPKISPLYRRQGQIIKKLDELTYKIDQVEKSHKQIQKELEGLPKNSR